MSFCLGNWAALLYRPTREARTAQQRPPLRSGTRPGAAHADISRLPLLSKSRLLLRVCSWPCLKNNPTDFRDLSQIHCLAAPTSFSQSTGFKFTTKSRVMVVKTRMTFWKEIRCWEWWGSMRGNAIFSGAGHLLGEVGLSWACVSSSALVQLEHHSASSKALLLHSSFTGCYSW